MVRPNFEPHLKNRQGRPYNPPMGPIGSTARERRIALGLTLEDVAERVGVSAAAISQFELGKTQTLKAPTAVRLAKVLEVEIETLLAVPA